MTRTEAEKMAKECLHGLGAPVSGFNTQGWMGARVGTEDVTFQFLSDAGELRCRAHIHHFRKPPAPGLAQRIEQLVATKPSKTAGGHVLLEPEVSLLSLARSWKQPAPAKQTVAEVRALMVAAVELGEALVSPQGFGS